jgi:hypothetical protein
MEMIDASRKPVRYPVDANRKSEGLRAMAWRDPAKNGAEEAGSFAAHDRLKRFTRTTEFIRQRAVGTPDA